MDWESTLERQGIILDASFRAAMIIENERVFEVLEIGAFSSLLRPE
jgi:hypothetical protein